MPQEIVDLDPARISSPHRVQESRRVLYPHLPSATCKVSKRVNSRVFGLNRIWQAGGSVSVRERTKPNRALSPARCDFAASDPHNRVVDSSIRIVAERAASLIAHTDGASTACIRAQVAKVGRS